MQPIKRSSSAVLSVITPIAIFCISIVGIYAISIYGLFFDTHKLQFPLSITNFKMDIYGAIAPFLVGLFFAAIYFWKKMAKITYIICFLFAVAISFLLGQPTNIGLVSNPAIFSFAVSLIALFFVIFLDKFKEKLSWKFNNKQYFIAALIVTTSCIPLSKIIVDFYYLPFVVNPIIGGNGFADGVLLSTMYSPLTVIMVSSIALFCSRLYNQIMIHDLQKQDNKKIDS
jgi:hypothetical protein